jgi:hypothetical protein
LPTQYWKAGLLNVVTADSWLKRNSRDACTRMQLLRNCTCRTGCVNITAGIIAAGLTGTLATCPSEAGAPCSSLLPVLKDAPPSPNTKLGAAGFSGNAAEGEAAFGAAKPFSAAGRVEVSDRLELGGDMLGVLSARLRLNAGAAVAWALLVAVAGRKPNDRPDS